MVFKKYRPAKQWGKMNTRIFKEILAARNKRDMPPFRIPEAVKAAGIEIFDPNDPDFPKPRVKPEVNFQHPAFKVPSIQEHPLYNAVKCRLFDGSEAMTDGIDQACALTKTVRRNSFPEEILQKAFHLTPENMEDRLRDAILAGEMYDPTLEKLPRRFDPVLFWVYYPRVHGTPVVKKNNIILENLYRLVLLTAIQHNQLDYLRSDADEPLSATLDFGVGFEAIPLVFRSQPHLTVQCPVPLTPWADSNEVEQTRSESVPDVTPVDPFIDLSSDHLYSKVPVLPRRRLNLCIDTVLWTREQNQKYPWTREQNCANAIATCFGSALAQATRHGSKATDLEKPITTRAVQLVDGRLDLVVYQLNTLDFRPEASKKNIVWIEPALQLYRAKPFYENNDNIEDLCSETFLKLLGMFLTR
ncbi:hypothetical protein AB6A40_000792 [Gnathostoma spinigerum]|uniref:Large ribosomal subunit protein mL37 n=1 Tax=Gnathostoma spinigerum TaxID=75299 RepID=A0ABD6EBD0_9BILA